MIVKNVFTQILISVIKIYQFIEVPKQAILYSVFGYVSQCRFKPTCSQYMIQQLKKHGTIIGLQKGGARIARCWHI